MVDFVQLSKDIAHPDRRTRLRAVEELDYAAEHAQAIPPLLQALNDAHFSVRHAAAQALGHAGDDRAVPSLETLLRTDTNFMVRGAAAAALGQIRSDASCEALAAALSDPDWHVRHHAAQGLQNIGADAVPVLLRQVTSADLECQRHACEALGDIGDARAIPPLLALIEHPDAPRRVNAIRALGKLKAQEAVTPCIAALNDPDPQVVIDAGYALAAIGDPAAIDPLVERLDNEKLIGRLADFGEQALYPLLDALDNPRNLRHRVGIIVALERVRHHAALWPLVEHLSHDAPEVRWAAINALGWIADPQAAMFLENLLDDDAVVNGRPLYAYALKALANIDTPEANGIIERWQARHGNG
jgi:HEAT repeat protein